MIDKFAGLHPTLRALLLKLSNSRFSVRDATSERLDWFKAGCPILATQDNFYGLKESGPRPAADDRSRYEGK